eukprot:TRINITY_DN36433_c0_g1_i1.p1 TRINITY_DN36433_c0_g1~~TRINITY_DN36433_c0_g1_i1.p1  ORF type:complete len:417 (+),score=29.42 TRINITY_DN36433_c0_g1_i1:134-1384(+)
MGRCGSLFAAVVAAAAAPVSARHAHLRVIEPSLATDTCADRVVGGRPSTSYSSARVMDGPPPPAYSALLGVAGGTPALKAGALSFPIANIAVVAHLQNAIIGPWGIPANASAAFTFGRWFFQKGVEPLRTCGPQCVSRNDGFTFESAVSLVAVYDDDFSHAAFSTLPKLALVCRWLVEGGGKCAQVIVTSQVQLRIAQLFCPGLHNETRFTVIQWRVFERTPGRGLEPLPTVRNLYAPQWLFPAAVPAHLRLLGVTPPNVVFPLGQGPADGALSLVWMSRGTTRVRGLRNEQEVLAAIAGAVKPTVTIKVYGDKAKPDSTWSAERAAFGSARVIMGPHGGAFGNLVFAAATTRIVELGGMLPRVGRKPRPCFMGLAHSLGLDYRHVDALEPFSYESGTFRVRPADVVAALPADVLR